MTREIGGYFSLELPEGKELYNNCIRLNSARNSLRYIIRAYNIKTIWLPYYTCPVVWQAAHDENCKIKFYHINSELMPEVDFGEDYAVYTNYFGICSGNIKKLVKRYKNLIIDNAQAFYAVPEQGLASFNSPRKFFGVGDGSYLFCKRRLNENFEQDISFERCSHLLIRDDTGAETGYKEFKKNDESLVGQSIKKMSNLTQRILGSIDYTKCKLKRRENFQVLHNALKKTNKLSIKLTDNDVPMVYPYLVENGETLKQKLINNKIFCATYWEEHPKKYFENYLQKNLIPLPIDQRYSIDDMNYILSNILEDRKGRKKYVLTEKTSKNLLQKTWYWLYTKQVNGIQKLILNVKRKCLKIFPLQADLIVVDNWFPAKPFLGFRVAEFKWLLTHVEKCKFITLSKVIYKFSEWKKEKDKLYLFSMPVSVRRYNKNKKLCADTLKIDKSKLSFLEDRPYKAKGAYCLFLTTAYLTRKFFEKNKIPFAFTLFPGEHLKFNNRFSDNMLKQVLTSPMFRGCFITQKIIYDYVVRKGFCDKSKLYYSYGGGFTQYKENTILPKITYPVEKKTIDICFVAFRYMPKGYDKGFDVVLDVAKILVPKYPNLHFHFVGNNTLDDFNKDYSEIQKNLHFYGIQNADFFPQFYAKMDIALSPNRKVNIPYRGFDGFPLQNESCIYGVALFCSDEWKMNDKWREGKDIVIIKPDAKLCADTLDEYLRNMKKVYEIGRNGEKFCKKYFNIEYQQADRAKFLKKYLDIDVKSDF